MSRYYIVVYILSLASVFNIHAQKINCVQNQYKFKNITIDQGLSNNNVPSICQGPNGLIWIATQNGLNKFNGQSITSYWFDSNDTTSISDDQINTIFLDSKNNMWLGGAGGLDLYQSEFNNFLRFRHKDIPGSMDQVFSITEDKNQKLWIGAYTGLYIYDLNTLEIQFISNQLKNEDGVLPDLVYRMMVDQNNKVWLSVLNNGLYVYDQVSSTFTSFKNIPNDSTSLSGNRIEKIYEDKQGRIWIGTLNDGLNLYIPETNSFKRYIPDSNNSYSTRVRAIFEDLDGNFFIGTRYGIYIMDMNTDSFRPYAYEGHYFSNISQNSILDCYIDNSSTLWIGTFSGGVNYTSLKRKEFIHYIAGKNDNHFLSCANIYSFIEDNNGNLWIGGDYGLNFLDRKDYTFKYFLNDPKNPNSLSYNDVKALEWDKNGNLWVGTNRGGLNYLDIKTGKFKTYKHNPQDTNSILGDKIYGLLNDKDNNLWIILNQNNDFTDLNIDILPSGEQKFIHLKEKVYFGLDQNSQGDIFIGAKYGFWIFNKKDSTFLLHQKEDIIGNTNTIMEDSERNLWIGSPKGLVRYDTKNQTYKSFCFDTGYPIGDVYGILEDSTKNLWISTNSGLLKLSKIVEDTTDLKIKVYDHYDGLQSKQFNYNAYYKCQSGEMVFGGINGFNTFFPNTIEENNSPANVVLTALRIYNTPVKIGDTIQDRIILNKSISVTKELRLGPKQKIFTLEFASLEPSNPDKYIFKTILQGLDKNWQYRKSGNNQVTYTNLLPGEYTFLVAAANSDGLWNENPLQLKIIIEPPFWETWWFRIMSFILFITLIFAFYYYRVVSLRRQNIHLEKVVKKRTSEISEKNLMLQEANEQLHENQEEILTQKEELEHHRNHLEELVKTRTAELENALEKAKESDSLKSAFLANISHEIRTPMNAIMGFSNMLDESDVTPEERTKYIEIIQSNSNSLLKIIDEIVDLSMIESKQLKIYKEIFDLNVVLDELYSYYSLVTTESGFIVRENNKLKEKNLRLNSDRVKIKQIITNLMDNACKFTQTGFIELGVYLKNENICIYVRDTGKGIASKDFNNIFQQFTKIEDDSYGWIWGLGLGLAISQKIAIELGGYIAVDSIENKGSTFTFNLPLKEILTEEEITIKELHSSSSSYWPNKTILIAEDVEANFMYLKSILKKSGLHIIWAKDGMEAIDAVSKNQDIDLILMDIKMPIKNGYDAAKEIKKLYPEKIIIAQTAYARPNEKQKFFDENFDEYIAKPINHSALLDTLNRFL